MRVHVLCWLGSLLVALGTNGSYTAQLLATNQLAVADALGGPFVDGEGRLLYVTAVNGSLETCAVSACAALTPDFRQLVSFFNAPSLDSVSLVRPRHGSSPPCDPALCSQKLHAQTRKNTLIVFTTCNFIEYSVRGLGYLLGATQRSDILIVDDHSTDGTRQYFIKKGFAVVTSDRPRGLTHSWNTGYRLAKLLGYKYLIFANNDVLVPAKSVEELRHDIRSATLVVPMTTRRGAGHNGMQSFRWNYRLPRGQGHDYINVPGHASVIQDTLSSMCRSRSDSRRVRLSSYKGNKIFNGFLFAVNMERMTALAFDGEHLFDPSNAIIGQESDLMERMAKNDDTPHISLCAFVYHYKSITVPSGFAGRYSRSVSRQNRNDLKRYHSSLKSNASSKAFPELYADYGGNIAEEQLAVHPSEPRALVIAFAVSDFSAKPSAGDAFTAREIGSSLVSAFRVQVRYLRRGPQWYSGLEDVDIVVAMLDAFDPTRIVRPKPTLLVLAWMRNWFSRWVRRPWIGNFDMLLVASEASKAFLETFNRPGFPVQCRHGCPSSLEALTLNRSTVPIKILRIATNATRFRKLPAFNASTSAFLADYVFTGSYFNAHREIMDLDPSDLPGHTGLIVGSAWDTSPVAHKWKGIIKGFVEYSSMPHVYNSVKMVIDDSNHVTKPWGSVNSRVFDALACGTLVITNGRTGVEEILPGTPTYSSVPDLVAKLKRYLSRPDEYERIVAELQNEVRTKHTYAVRAAEFAAHVLDGFGVALPVRTEADWIPASELERSRHAICVGVRTMAAQARTLEPLLRSLLEPYRSLSPMRDVDVQLFVMDTEFRASENESFIGEVLDRVNHDMGRVHARLVWDEEAHSRSSRNYFYGYDSSDVLLQHILKQKHCGWVMFTNGDNLYNSTWFDTVAPHLKTKGTDVVAWDFVSHHPRDGIKDTVISVDIKRKFIDLGSFAVRTSAVRKSGAKFLPDSLFTKNLYARDFFFVSKVQRYVKPDSIKYIHSTLFFHQ